MRHKLTTAAIGAIVFQVASLLLAQNVTIHITDKLKNPRASFGLTVTVHGVDFRGTPVKLASGTTTTEPDGRIEFRIPVERLNRLADTLQQSKEVRITLEPDDDNFSDVVISSLLGTSDQTIAVVMKETGAPTHYGPFEQPCYWPSSDRMVYYFGCGPCYSRRPEMHYHGYPTVRRCEW